MIETQDVCATKKSLSIHSCSIAAVFFENVQTNVLKARVSCLAYKKAWARASAAHLEIAGRV